MAVALSSRKPEAGPSPSSAPRIPLDDLVDIVTALAAAPARWPAFEQADTRDGVRLFGTSSFDVWLLTWPAGANVEPHDHGDSHGAFVVVEGELDEIRWCGSDERRRRLPTGDVSTVEVGVVHDVVGASEGVAYSIHAYSPRLAEMRYYAQDELIAVEPVTAASHIATVMNTS